MSFPCAVRLIAERGVCIYVGRDRARVDGPHALVRADVGVHHRGRVVAVLSPSARIRSLFHLSGQWRRRLGTLFWSHSAAQCTMHNAHWTKKHSYLISYLLLDHVVISLSSRHSLYCTIPPNNRRLSQVLSARINNHSDGLQARTMEGRAKGGGSLYATIQRRDLPPSGSAGQSQPLVRCLPSQSGGCSR